MERLTIGRHTYQLELTEAEVKGWVRVRGGRFNPVFQLTRPQGIPLEAFEFQKATYWPYFLRSSELSDSAKRALSQHLVGYQHLVAVTAHDGRTSYFSSIRVKRWNQKNPNQKITGSHHGILIELPATGYPIKTSYVLYRAWNEQTKTARSLAEWLETEPICQFLLELKDTYQLSTLKTFDVDAFLTTVQAYEIHSELSDLGLEPSPALSEETLYQWLCYHLRKGTHPEQIALRLWWAESADAVAS